MEIERHWGTPIPAIFRDHGESAFRSSERAILKSSSRDLVVIATGGGAAVDPNSGTRRCSAVMERSSSRSMRVRRRCSPGCSDKRQTRGRRSASWQVDPLERIRDLKSARQSIYDRAHLTVSSDGISVDEVADELAAIARLAGGQPLGVLLDAASGTSDIRVGPGAISRIGEWVRERWPAARALVDRDGRECRTVACRGEEDYLRAAGLVGINARRSSR